MNNRLNRRKLAGLMLGGVLAAANAVAGPLGYVINFSGQFGTMDLGTGAFSPIGPGTLNTSDGSGGSQVGRSIPSTE